MKIRNYKNTDYSQVSLILKEAVMFDEVWDSKDNLESMIVKDPESIFVAEDNDVVVGNLYLIPFGVKALYLFRLAVKKEFRKQGIASALIEAAQNIAKKRKVSEIGLFVDSTNKHLQSYYKRRGFKIYTTKYFYMGKEKF